MTNNMDEFEHEEMEHEAAGAAASKKTGNAALATFHEAWRTRPLFKLVVIMAVVALAIVISLNVFGGPAPSTEPTKLVKAPDLNEAPGGKASPYFIEQNKQAANQRADQAMQQGGSAIPTPVGQDIDLGEKKTDPLVEFRAETERLKQELKQEHQQNTQQIQQLQQQVQAPQPKAPEPPFDDSLAQAMQRQMQQLSESWTPTPMKLVAGTIAADTVKPDLGKTTTGESTGAANGTSSNAGVAGSNNSSQQQPKPIITAGTVSYAQMLTEANSDVPGPVLAQIVSGPFSGARAIGSFEVSQDYLIIHFSLVNFNGKDYSINALALNPDTTLGGMASEVDQRYFARVVLPAAASFAQAFGSALGQGSSSTTVSNNAVISDQARKGIKDGIYSGIGQAGQTVGQFFQDQANQTKPLVRLAAGTPMALFFVASVLDNSGQAGGLVNGYGNNGLLGGLGGGVPGYANGYGANGQYGVNGQYGNNGQYSPNGQYGNYQNGQGNYSGPYTPTNNGYNSSNVRIYGPNTTGGYGTPAYGNSGYGQVNGYGTGTYGR